MSYTIPPPPPKPESKHVPIPPAFLTGPPPGGPVKAVPIPFASSPIPEYDGRTALTIDNVLSREECAQLISLAESSVPPLESPDGSADSSPWRPALVRLAPGVEIPSRPGYRESGRILWYSQDVVDRIWERCAQAEGLAEQLAVVPQQHGKVRLGEWHFRRVNDRMSFLRYAVGQYFKRKEAPS